MWSDVIGTAIWLIICLVFGLVFTFGNGLGLELPLNEFFANASTQIT